MSQTTPSVPIPRLSSRPTGFIEDNRVTMSKIGRNERCPCGSGKKYKQCCLRRDEANRRAQPLPAQIPWTPNISPPHAWSLPTPTPSRTTRGLKLHPHVIAKIFEESEQFTQMKRAEPKRAAAFWTNSRLAAMSTDDILTKLADLGVETSPEAFIAASAPFHSAWDLSATWKALGPRRIDRHDDDFLGMAATELWRRFCSDRPSFEMLDDEMQEGYRCSRLGDAVAACTLWQETWARLRLRLTPSMRTCDDAEYGFPGTQCLFNWLQDFRLELHNASIDDPAWAPRGIELCRAAIEQFPDEQFVPSFRADVAEFYFLSGDTEEGERLLRQLIAEDPDAPEAYAVLSDCLEQQARRGQPPGDLQPAILLLEQALARPVREAASWDLERRLAALRDLSRPFNRGVQSRGPR
jgi:hypothetical protein